MIKTPLRGEPVRYEVDRDSGALFVGRFLHATMACPGNYGFIPQTRGADSGPLNVLVVGPTPIIPGAILRSQPIGVLVVVDKTGTEETIIAVPVQNLNPYHKNVTSYHDLPEILLKQITHFFEHYRDLDTGTRTKTIRWGEADEAAQQITDAIAAEREALLMLGQDI
ncbi:MAG: inorganic diphosphatase [Rhodospirillaceae bacterium]